MKKIVTIGGGSGQSVLLSALREIKDIEITAVVSMSDSGGSTGILRDKYGVLPPGDVLKCIAALAENQQMAREFLLGRFTGIKSLEGHTAGNLLLTFISQHCDSFPQAVSALGKFFKIKGQVMPVTLDRATLVVELSDGSRVYGESAIDVRGPSKKSIRDAFLVPHHSDEMRVYPPVLEAIAQADFIIISAGSLFTSTIPNFLVPGVKMEVIKSPAKLIYIVNLMTNAGETDGLNAYGFVQRLENYIFRKPDYVVCNSKAPRDPVMKNYELENANAVLVPEGFDWSPRQLVLADLVDATGGIIRHDPLKLAEIISEIIGGDNENTVAS